MSEMNNNREIAIKLSGVKKQYKLGQIGGGTLTGDLQSWWARIRGKEDPNVKIGVDQRLIGKTFMALNGIDLTIYKGEAVGIIGGNGAGKSTMLKLLSRVTAPTQGEIDIYGRIASMLEVGTGFSGELTGRENVYMNGAILGMTKAEIDAKMEDIIEFSEVRDFIDTPVKRYSSGMYVKLAFSVAAHLDSEIMIMDEVLAVGDMAFQKKCLDKMRDAAKKEGRTVLYVSHNMATIRQLCDRCIVLDQGKVVFEGDVEESIKRYMGIDGSNEFPVEHDFSQKRRTHSFGQKVLFHKVKFSGENAVYEVGTPIDVEAEIMPQIDIEEAQILFTIKDSNYIKIAAALSDKFVLEKGKLKRVKFRVESSFLAHDIYCGNIEVLTTNEDGSYLVYDNPGSKMLFMLTNDVAHGIRWEKKYWGNVILTQMKLIDDEK